MLNPIFDSHPLEFIWRDKEEDFLSDISSAISLANNIFETIETKNAYLISLAVAFKKSAPKNLDIKVQITLLSLYTKQFLTLKILINKIIYKLKTSKITIVIQPMVKH